MTGILQKRVFWGIAGLLVGVWATLFVATLVTPGMAVREHPSPYDVDTTVRIIVRNAVLRGWRVSKVYDLREELARPAEEKIPAIKVVQLCQPDLTHDLLKSNENRAVATVMPCGFAVYEKNGQVYVAFVNRELMGAIFGDQIRTAMNRVSAEDDEILKFLVQR